LILTDVRRHEDGACRPTDRPVICLQTAPLIGQQLLTKAFNATPPCITTSGPPQSEEQMPILLEIALNNPPALEVAGLEVEHDGRSLGCYTELAASHDTCQKSCEYQSHASGLTNGFKSFFLGVVSILMIPSSSRVSNSYGMVTTV